MWWLTASTSGTTSCGTPLASSGFEVVARALAQRPAQALQRAQRPGHAEPHQESHHQDHAGVAQQFLLERFGLGLQARTGALGGLDQHAPGVAGVFVVVDRLAQRGHAHRVLLVHRVVEHRRAVGRLPGRKGQGGHAHERVLRRARIQRRALGDALHAHVQVLVAQVRGLEHRLHREGLLHPHAAVARDHDAVGQRLHRLEQALVVGDHQRFGERLVVAPAVERHQPDDARHQQREQARADAEAPRLGAARLRLRRSGNLRVHRQCPRACSPARAR
jgi:hypothetical protein